MGYYAVAKGKTIGVFNNWDECKKSVNGYKGAIHKKFDTKKKQKILFNRIKQTNILLKK